MSSVAAAGINRGRGRQAYVSYRTITRNKRYSWADLAISCLTRGGGRGTSTGGEAVVGSGNGLRNPYCNLNDEVLWGSAGQHPKRLTA